MGRRQGCGRRAHGGRGRRAHGERGRRAHGARGRRALGARGTSAVSAAMPGLGVLLGQQAVHSVHSACFDPVSTQYCS